MKNEKLKLIETELKNGCEGLGDGWNSKGWQKGTLSPIRWEESVCNVVTDYSW